MLFLTVFHFVVPLPVKYNSVQVDECLLNITSHPSDTVIYFKQCTNVTDILKICMYLSKDDICNFDQITAVSYLETFAGFF